MLTMLYEWPTSQSVTTLPFIPISVSTCSLSILCSDLYLVDELCDPVVSLPLSGVKASGETAAWPAQSVGGGAGGSEVPA